MSSDGNQSEQKEMCLSGSYTALAGALCVTTIEGYSERLPTFVLYWLSSADFHDK